MPCYECPFCGYWTRTDEVITECPECGCEMVRCVEMEADD